jgi:hypothetical protein
MSDTLTPVLRPSHAMVWPQTSGLAAALAISTISMVSVSCCACCCLRNLALAIAEVRSVLRSVLGPQ